MSRIGKKLRVLPVGVTAEIGGGKLKIIGPKGVLVLALHPLITVVVKDNTIAIAVADENNKRNRALWGTFSSLIANMILGVTQGFKKQLEINGVGYKAALKGADLNLEVGYTHPVAVKAPEKVKFTVEKNIITIEGIDKQLVGETAAKIRAIKKPEPYKGKGIKYTDEIVRRKAGKTAAKTAAA